MSPWQFLRGLADSLQICSGSTSSPGQAASLCSRPVACAGRMRAGRQTPAHLWNQKSWPALSTPACAPPEGCGQGSGLWTLLFGRSNWGRSLVTSGTRIREWGPLLLEGCPVNHHPDDVGRRITLTISFTECPLGGMRSPMPEMNIFITFAGRDWEQTKPGFRKGLI